MAQYQAALEIKPDSYETLNNWGAALYRRGKLADAGEREALAEAIEKYTKAIQIKPNYYDSLLNRGIARSDLAITDEDDAWEAMFGLATEDFNAALRIKPNSHEALADWGNALRNLAVRLGEQQPERADLLMDQAVQKYQEALKRQPDYLKAINDYIKALTDWGNMVLLRSATKKEEEDAELLVNEAMDKFFEADRRQPGSSAYYLARHAALSGDNFGYQESLRRAHRYNKLPPQDDILADTAFDSVRDTDWFKAFLDQL